MRAPTGLKIATLAIVMEKGLSFLPHGAMQASLIAIFIGVLFELLLAFKKRDEKGVETSRFWMVPIPAALGFALILPASLNIGMAVGSVFSAVWARFAPGEGKSFELYATPLASGLVAGEAMMGSIMMPALTALMQLVIG